MSKRVRRRRGTQAQHDEFTGADGELTVNTTDYRVHAHDGSTAGGFPTAREDEVSDLSGVSDASTARSNLGLGSAATESDTKYVFRSNNLSDLGSASSARSNLGLGSAATSAEGDFLSTNGIRSLDNAGTVTLNPGEIWTPPSGALYIYASGGFYTEWLDESANAKRIHDAGDAWGGGFFITDGTVLRIGLPGDASKAADIEYRYVNT